MGECHDINYVEFVYYVIMYLIINNSILDNLKVNATFLSNINVTSRWQIYELVKTRVHIFRI